ncbi:hypothetical protein Ddye_011969 [Dipteronia dyeriana]|uniref:Uncharacterized protein n=1 Tax=Dipteronia dyeriana TaxID=168575 RepID=A0AAD9X3F4_9ROSI|nr:hypothetical protein Ddye_011969 [Dipteronia dyeriana]
MATSSLPTALVTAMTLSSLTDNASSSLFSISPGFYIWVLRVQNLDYQIKMPHRTRPMTALLVFTGLNVVLVSTISPVYDFVCFHPFWERRRERCRQEREATALAQDLRGAELPDLVAKGEAPPHGKAGYGNLTTIAICNSLPLHLLQLPTCSLSLFYLVSKTFHCL